MLLQKKRDKKKQSQIRKEHKKKKKKWENKSVDNGKNTGGSSKVDLIDHVYERGVRKGLGP